MPGDWIKCPRCELNYIKKGEEFCDVCKAELKKGPQLIFAIDEEEELDENLELCPRYDQNYDKSGERLSENGLRGLDSEEKDVEDSDDKWKEFLDDEEEEEEESEEMLSLSKLVEEEGDELFDDEKEEDEYVSEEVDEDDFEIPEIDSADFEEDDEEEEEEDDEDFD